MEDKKSYYAIIPSYIRYNKNISNGAKLLYGEITALCNEQGYCWAKNKYFADLYGVSKNTVSRWIGELIDNNYILSQITYDSQTKEILERSLSLVYTYHQNCVDPIIKNGDTPIIKNGEDNNTLLNNTFNNTNKEKEVLKEKDIFHKYGEYGWIKLKDYQYDKLCKDFTKEYIDKVIILIDEYIQKINNKNKYKDWNLVIRGAIRDKWSILKNISTETPSTLSEETEMVTIMYIDKYGGTAIENYPRKKGQVEWTEEDKERILKEKGGKKWLG